MTPSTAASRPASQGTSRLFFLILAGLTVAMALWVAAWRLKAFSFFVYDDTYIVLRYAKNFLLHGQLVFNLGEAVEGYTNPLHLALITFLGACGVDVLDAARIINALSYAGFAGLLAWVFYRRHQPAAGALAASLALANPALALWVWGGMEVPLTVFLLAAAQVIMMRALLDEAARTNKNAILAAAFYGLAFLTRPDNALYAVPAFFAWLLFKPKKPALLFTGVMGAVVTAHTLIRLIFYGDVVPNTFYAKITGTPAVAAATGIKYVQDGVFSSPFYYLAGFAALAALALFRKPARGFALFAVASIGLGMAYVISIGGDFMPGHRFIMPWLPLCLLGLGLLLEDAVLALRYAGLIMCLFIMKAIFILPDDLHMVDATALAGESTGAYIEKHWPRRSTVALNAAGAIPYVNMDKSFIDMLGLNDAHIAHRVMPDLHIPWQHKPGHGKGDGAYVLSRQPDYIILSSVAGDNGLDTPVLPSDAELGVSAEFKRCYKNEKLEIPWPPILRDYNNLKSPTYIFSYYRRTCPKT